jgi:hypothetical protein
MWKTGTKSGLRSMQLQLYVVLHGVRMRREAMREDWMGNPPHLER